MTEISSLDVTIRASSAGLVTGLDQALNQIRGFGTRASSSVSGVGGAIATSFMVGVSAVQAGARTISNVMDTMVADIAAKAVMAAAEWESAFAGVAKTLPEGADLGVIEQGLRDMATGDSPVAGLENAHEQLATIAANAGQLGVAAEDILPFTENIAMMTMSTNLSADAAAQMSARFMNITGMDMSNIDRLGSTVVNLGNNMATDEATILQYGQRLAGAGTQAGMAEDEILGLGAALASVGLEPEAGATSMSRVINEMTAAAATGGPELETFAATAQMTADAFATMAETDPAQALQEFIAGFGELDVADQLATLDELGLSGERIVSMMQRLSGAPEILSQGLEVASQGWNDNTALMAEAETRFDTTLSKMDQLNNKINDLGITLGNVLLPVFNELISVGGGVVDIFAGIFNQDTAQLEGGLDSVLGVLENLTGLDLPDGADFVATWQSNIEMLGTIIDTVIARLGQGIQNLGIELNKLALDAAWSLMQMTPQTIAAGGPSEQQQASYQSQRGLLEYRQEAMRASQEFAAELRSYMATGDFSAVVTPDITFDTAQGQRTTSLFDDWIVDAIGTGRDIDIAPFIANVDQDAILAGLEAALDFGDLEAVEMLLPISLAIDPESVDVPAVASQLMDMTWDAPVPMPIPVQVQPEATAVDPLAMGAGAPDVSLPVAVSIETNINSDELMTDIAAQASGLSAAITMPVDVTLSVGSMDTGQLDAAMSAAMGRYGGGSSSRGGSSGRSAPASSYGGAMGASGVPMFRWGGEMGNDGLAFLHAGERVLSPEETAAFNAGQRGGGGGDVYLTAYGSNPYELLHMVERANMERGR